MRHRYKRIFILSILMIFLFSSFSAFAQDDDGIIDFYTVFSKDDVNKNRVGNSVYNWSIYMPQDAYINKDPKGSYFTMTSNSYKANISVEAIINKDGYSSLDDILLYGDDLIGSYYGSSAKIYSLKKGKDKKNQEYIEMTNVYTDSYYVFIDEEETSGTYNLMRIYLSKNKKYNYIYRLSINMDLNFYNEHKNLLYKIADSFEANFDAKNPNIKDLADNVTSWRVHKNSSYGWQIDLPPYWKTTDIYNLEYNSSTQSFAPLYSDEEMGLVEQDKSQDVVTSSEQQQQEPDEYLSVSFVANSNVDFSNWVNTEISDLELYNKNLYKIDSMKNINISGATARLYDLLIQRTVKKNFIEKRLYVDFNNNKFIVKLYVEKSKYEKDKQKYDKIINSFKPLNIKSKYLSSIIWKGSINQNDGKRLLKLSRVPFEMSVSKSYRTNMPYYYGYYYNDTLISTKMFPSDSGISDSENLNLFNGIYSMINITGSVNLDPIEKIIKNNVQYLVESNEYKSKAANMNLQKYSDKNVSIYKLSYIYDIKKLSELVKENPNRDYNFSNLQNRIIYMIKYKQYYYTITLSVPVLFWNDYVLNNFENSFKTLKLENVKLSALNIKYTKDDLEKYKKKD